jgi:hypothetical protein
MAVTYLILAAVVIVAIYLGVRYFVRSSERYAGGRMIVCPETKKEAMVELNVERAMLTSLIGQTDLRLESCWRWPLREDCGQQCLLQLNDVEPECLVRSVLEKWYRGKQCAFCRRPFDEIALLDHKPALLSPGGLTLEWNEIPVDDVMETTQTHLPVCWDCQIAQSFKRVHPDLVVERPPLVRHASGRM